MIELKGVVFHYRAAGESPVLRGIDLVVRPGEFLAVVGPNGSGKTTLARHLNGLLLPDEGEVTVEGLSTAEPANLGEVRRRVGMVFQNPESQLVAPTVADEVAFGPENLGLPVEEVLERVSWALSRVEMERLRRSEPHLLSGGQKQRVAIAGVLAMKPRYLVLDEATTMLDPAGRREVLETVDRLHREEGVAVVHVTHRMDEVLRAERVIVLSRGEIVLEGSPGEVFSQARELHNLGLELPVPAELARRLRERGFPLGTVLAEGEVVDELVRCWRESR
ncbi:MAG: energy-coupling factor transporter ATPase [Armatimonadetes bacterium]|nr:energy-coupling factor transporter ATPase [Armatimonadota bacterium]